MVSVIYGILIVVLIMSVIKLHFNECSLKRYCDRSFSTIRQNQNIMRNLNIQSKDLSKVEDITFFFLRKDMLLDQFGIKVRLHKTNDNYTLRVYM